MARIGRIDSKHDIGKACKVKLISKTYTKDSIGNSVPTNSYVEIWCNVRSVSSSEFANTGEIGIRAALIFSVWEKEYAGQELIEYNNDMYSVYRTYIRADGRIELYVEKKVGCE